MSTTSIYDLEISGRTKLALLRLGIRTLEDLRAVPIAELEQQKHIGLFVLSEIKRVLSENGMPVGSTDMAESEKKKSYSTEQIEEMKQHFVTELELSSRALRALFSANYETVDKIVTLKANDFRDLKGLSSKAVEEIIAKRDKWLKDNGFIEIDRQKELAISETMEQLIRHLSTVIAPITRIFWNKLYKILLDEKLLDELKMGVDTNSTAQNFQLIFSLPQFVTCLKEFWKKQLPDGLMQKQACLERIESLNLKVSSQLLIDISLHTEIIFLYWDYYIFKRERFSDLYQKLGLPDERTNAIILMKLEGASLQETGEHFGITRERVRQIVVKQVRNLPELFEDCFAQPYETFRLTKSEFSRLFPEITSESYEYIALRYKKGKQGLSYETLTEYNGYWKDVGTLGSYWQANMELIDIIPEFNLYEEFWKIYTNSAILPPQYIAENAVIDRSIIGNGCEIYGEVHNCVISAGVTIEEGAVVRDSIIMSDCTIGKGCVIDKSIIAENTKIGEGAILGIGSEEPNKLKPAVYSFGLVTIGENSVIPDHVQIGKNTAISGITNKEDYPDGVLGSGETLIKAGEIA